MCTMDYTLYSLHKVCKYIWINHNMEKVELHVLLIFQNIGVHVDAIETDL